MIKKNKYISSYTSTVSFDLGPVIIDQQQQQQQSIKKLSTVPLYSDEYDNIPNTVTSNLFTPINHIRNSLSSTTPIPSPEPRVPTQTDRRRSLSPPLPPQMSPDNGRPLHHSTLTTAQHITQINQEPTESVARLQTNLHANTSTHQQTRKSPIHQASSSSSSSTTSTNRKRRSPSPQSQPTINTHSRHRPTQTSSPPTSSSESILTAREKRVRQKFNSDIELQAYEKRLKDIEKKIRQLVKRAFEIFDENRTTASPSGTGRSTKENDENSLHRRDTELLKKDGDTSSISIQKKQSDIVTSDASDLECRVRAYREQLKAKKLELERLKQRKNKEILRRQEDELKKQIESYDHEIQTLRLQPIQQEQTVPVPSSSSSSVNLSKEKNKSVEKQITQHRDDEEKEIDLGTLETPRDERDTQHDALSISNANDLANETKYDNDSRRSSIDHDKLFEDPVKSQSPQVSSSSSPVPSEKSKSSSLSNQERIKSPIPPLKSEAVKSISLSSQNRIKSPSPSARSETSSPSYSSAHERIESPSPPPATFQPIKSTTPPIHSHAKSPSPPAPPSILESRQEHVKSPSPQPSVSESNSTSIDKHVKSPSPQPSVSESSSTSIDKRVKSPLPFEQIQTTTSSVHEYVTTPSTSISEQIPIKKSLSSLSSRSESIKSPSPPIQDDSKSTSSIKEQIPPSTIVRSQSNNNDYDEDFSESIHSQTDTSTKIKIEDIDIESIQEDIKDQHAHHDENHSSTSKSTDDEQSEILVLVKKSANTTPRQDDELISSSSRLQKIESEDGQHQQIKPPTQVDQLTETLIKNFIDEAISQGKEIVYRKSQDSPIKEETGGVSDEDISDEEHNKEIDNHQDDDDDNVIQILAIQQEFLEQLDAAANGNNEQEDLNIDLTRLEDRNADELSTGPSPRVVVEEPIKPVVPHTREEVTHLCHEALTILYNQNTDFSDKSNINRRVPESYYNINQSGNENIDSENENIYQSRHAYCQMIFDLCVELLNEMYSPNIRLPQYPEWQKTKLVSKRFYRFNPPKTRHEAESFIRKKVLEILNLTPRQITYSKWRMPLDRRHGHEQFEIVLDEELRRTEIDWIDYENDYCDTCQKYNTSLCPQGCQTYEANRYADHAKDTVPNGIEIAKSIISSAGLGAFARKFFSKNTFLGPYTGDRHRSAERANQSGYAWAIDDAKAGEELFVHYGEEYARALGIDPFEYFIGKLQG
ncbi:hypothetical protein I4U23_019518 [Adineta vaga]|nr:hypothetical protein I4U23_019518 [Adineta vaga]